MSSMDYSRFETFEDFFKHPHSCPKDSNFVFALDRSNELRVVSCKKSSSEPSCFSSLIGKRQAAVSPLDPSLGHATMDQVVKWINLAGVSSVSVKNDQVLQLFETAYPNLRKVCAKERKRYEDATTPEQAKSLQNQSLLRDFALTQAGRAVEPSKDILDLIENEEDRCYIAAQFAARNPNEFIKSPIEYLYKFKISSECNTLLFITEMIRNKIVFSDVNTLLKLVPNYRKNLLFIMSLEYNKSQMSRTNLADKDYLDMALWLVDEVDDCPRYINNLNIENSEHKKQIIDYMISKDVEKFGNRHCDNKWNNRRYDFPILGISFDEYWLQLNPRIQVVRNRENEAIRDRKEKAEAIKRAHANDNPHGTQWGLSGFG